MLSETQHISLPQGYEKVLHLHPALNKSIVFLGITYSERDDRLVHVSYDGKLLGEVIYQ